MIQKLNTKDLNVLNQMIGVQKEAYEIEAQLIGTRNIPPLNETHDELANVEDEQFFGFTMGEELMGFVATMEEGPCLRISRLVVDPKYFRNGIGKALILYVQNHRAPGQKIIVSTGAKNLPGRRLYEKFGFELVKTFVVADNIEIVEYKR